MCTAAEATTRSYHQAGVTTRLGRVTRGWFTDEKTMPLVVVRFFLLILPDTFPYFESYHHLRRCVLGDFFSVNRVGGQALGRVGSRLAGGFGRGDRPTWPGAELGSGPTRRCDLALCRGASQTFSCFAEMTKISGCVKERNDGLFMFCASCLADGCMVRPCEERADI